MTYLFCHRQAMKVMTLVRALGTPNQKRNQETNQKLGQILLIHRHGIGKTVLPQSLGVNVVEEKKNTEKLELQIVLNAIGQGSSYVKWFT